MDRARCDWILPLTFFSGKSDREYIFLVFAVSRQPLIRRLNTTRGMHRRLQTTVPNLLHGLQTWLL